MVGDIWYRIEDRQYASCVDEYKQYVFSGEVQVNVYKYKVIKETPKGVWVAFVFGGSFNCVDKHFILTSSHKQFACPTIEKALISFKARKKAQIKIYKAKLLVAEKALYISETLKII